MIDLPESDYKKEFDGIKQAAKEYEKEENIKLQAKIKIIIIRYEIH